MDVLGIGCLAGKQSVELVMACRWLSPLVLLQASLLASEAFATTGTLQAAQTAVPQVQPR